jgi:hypothetical protein
MTAVFVVALLPVAGFAAAGMRRAVVVTAVLGYALLVAAVYASDIVPVYRYAHLIDAAPDRQALLVATALAVAPSLWIPVSARRPSTVLVWVLYLIGYVPAIVIGLYLTGHLGHVLPYDLALLASMAILGLLLRLPPLPLAVRGLSLTGYTRLIVGLAALCLVYVAATFGIHRPPSLSAIYETRAEFATAIPSSLGGGYIVPWAANAINPTLMALGIARRRWGLVVLAVVGQVLIYSVTGYRTTLFSIVVVPVVYTGVTFARRSFGVAAALGLSVALILALATPLATRETRALATRTVATPAQVTTYYFDYFSEHRTYELSHSFLSSFVARPYAQEPPDLIGGIYFAPEHPQANADLWGDAYANFRVAGIIVFSVLFGCALLIADGVGQGRDLRVAGPPLAMIGLSLSNSGFFTTVLTLGFGAACALIALMPAMPLRAPPSHREPDAEEALEPDHLEDPVVPGGGRPAIPPA